MKQLNTLKDTILKNPYFIRYQMIIVPALSGLVSIVLIVLILIPQVQEIFRIQKETEINKTQTGILQKKITDLSGQDVNKLRQLVDTTQIAVPPDKDIPGAVDQVNNYLSSNGMVVNNISFSNLGLDLPSGGNFQIKLEITGSMVGLKNFSKQLDSAPRIMKIDGLDMYATRNVGNIQASMSINTFYLPLATSIGGVEDKLPAIAQDEIAKLEKLRASIYSAPSYSSPSTPTSTVDLNTQTGKINPFE